MATFYLDPEQGNDANDGLSYANRWKTFTSGATAARIAPGDTIRVAASPDPSSIGTGKWTGGGRPSSINISSSTNATPIVVTTSSAHGLTAGDYVSIATHSTNTNANGVWKVGTVSSSTAFQILNIDGTNTTGTGAGTGGNVTNINNCVVKLTTAVTKNIALCGGINEKPLWTGVTNVTVSRSTSTGTWKEGYSSMSLAIAAAFTTGKAAYYTLPAALDLSAYQQVSFWIRQTTGTVGAAGAVYVALCSDTTGDTVVHTCNVPALVSTGQWYPVVVDLGANLSTSIQSIAFYVVTDNAAQTFLIDNVIACKASSSADSLDLTSLISKSSGTGDEAWYGLQSINNDVLMIGNDTSFDSSSTSVRGYSGASESVTTYKIDPLSYPAGQSAAIQDSGTAGSLITFSGGWSRSSNMATQSGQSWIDFHGATSGTGLDFNNKSYVSVDKINVCRGNFGIGLSGSNNIIGSAYATGFYNGSMQISGTGHQTTSLWLNNSYAAIGTGGTGNSNIFGDFKSMDNCVATTTLSGGYNKINSISGGNIAAALITTSNLSNCSIGTISLKPLAGQYGIAYGTGGNNFINGGSISGSGSGVNITSNSILNLNNVDITTSAEVNIGSTYGSVYSNRHDNTDGNNWIWQPAGTINQQTTTVDSPATTSWKMSPTNSASSANLPLNLLLGTVVCAASSLVTVTARMRRDNTGLTMRLICPGWQIVGVASDVSSDMTAAANTWETVTITFTPTKAGGVNIYAYAFGGTTYSGYVCNLTASQA